MYTERKIGYFDPYSSIWEISCVSRRDLGNFVCFGRDLGVFDEKLRKKSKNRVAGGGVREGRF
jgi:hypothetical protein